jgi:hypothetical protein
MIMRAVWGGWRAGCSRNPSDESLQKVRYSTEIVSISSHPQQITELMNEVNTTCIFYKDFLFHYPSTRTIHPPSARFKPGNFNLPVTFLINGCYDLTTNLFVWRLLINVVGGLRWGGFPTAIHQEYKNDSGKDLVYRQTEKQIKYSVG